MLNVQNGELIHSFIYRTHILNGVSEFSNIITNNGCWASFPVILKNTLEFFKPIDDSIFLQLLRDVGWAQRSYEIFDCPASYRYELGKFFGKSGIKLNKSMSAEPIRYCLACINEQIEQYGYGTLNIAWHKDEVCKVHETGLFILQSKTRRETTDALKSIYRGIHPKAYSKFKYRKDYFHYPRDYEHGIKVDHMAPCLADAFKSFILQNFRNFSLELLGRNYRSTSYVTKKVMMIKVYKSAKRNNNKLFLDFWSSAAKPKDINTGVINRKTITEKMYKTAFDNCGNCKYLKCFANLAIIPIKPDVYLIKKCDKDYHLLKCYFESNGIYSYSEQTELLKKMSTGQKHHALSELRGNSLFDECYRD